MDGWWEIQHKASVRQLGHNRQTTIFCSHTLNVKQSKASIMTDAENTVI